MAREEIEIEGFVGKDPQYGKNKASETLIFPVGVTQSAKNKATGEYENNTTWYEVEIWNANQSAYWKDKIHKGDKVIVRGKPKLRVYLNQANLPMGNISIFAQEIITMIKKDSVKQQVQISNHPKYTKQPEKHEDFLDDDIPF